jgi:hypothetical protein
MKSSAADFAAFAMREIGYAELPMLEVISLNPDADSCRRLRQAGFGRDV